MSSSSDSFSSLTLNIGIVGFGTFGQFLAKTMIQQGHTISATSRTDYSQLCHQLGISFFRDVAAFVEADNDVILISTSILSLSKMLKSIPFRCLKRRTLFVDVLSVKEHPRDVLLQVEDEGAFVQVLPEEMDLLCTHPMFGPESGKSGWEDLVLMYDKVRVRDEATCSSFLRIFERQGCRMMQMSCEEHDRLAARSQFLTHAIGRILSETGIESTSINTKGFETLVKLVSSISRLSLMHFSLLQFARSFSERKESTTNDSFDLFSGLFIHNRFAKQELMNLEHAFQMVKKKLLQTANEEQIPNKSNHQMDSC